MTLPKLFLDILDGIPQKELEEYLDQRKGKSALRKEDQDFAEIAHR